MYPKWYPSPMNNPVYLLPVLHFILSTNFITIKIRLIFIIFITILQIRHPQSTQANAGYGNAARADGEVILPHGELPLFLGLPHRFSNFRMHR